MSGARKHAPNISRRSSSGIMRIPSGTSCSTFLRCKKACKAGDASPWKWQKHQLTATAIVKELVTKPLESTRQRCFRCLSDSHGVRVVWVKSWHLLLSMGSGQLQLAGLKVGGNLPKVVLAQPLQPLSLAISVAALAGCQRGCLSRHRILVHKVLCLGALGPRQDPAVCNMH